MPTVPMELRIKAAILVSVSLWLLWLVSWLRFVNEALEDGIAAARVDRHLWLRMNTIACLDTMCRAAEQGVYPVRVIRAALKPYYPKEESRP